MFGLCSFSSKKRAKEVSGKSRVPVNTPEWWGLWMYPLLGGVCHLHSVEKRSGGEMYKTPNQNHSPKSKIQF